MSDQAQHIYVFKEALQCTFLFPYLLIFFLKLEVLSFHVKKIFVIKYIELKKYIQIICMVYLMPDQKVENSVLSLRTSLVPQETVYKDHILFIAKLV